eukprot:TRINITY_DN15492_c0_g1_i1.p1 TRINITY_DN15492_c0_g1~~TRINITY_DN15492_c0_g1_i1.p1  ORF type:complete len:153 (-),score=51.34 TRINITY_DN15492_c0_g1_i1:40-474(-)
MSNVFVYGSLMSTRVLEILLGRVPKIVPGTLKEHHRYSIKNRAYPAAFPSKGSSIEGKLLMGISAREKKILDDFEDVEYDCVPVKVHLKEEKEEIDATVYLYRSDLFDTLHGKWDFEVFERERLEDFLKMCQKFAKETNKRIPF